MTKPSMALTKVPAAIDEEITEAVKSQLARIVSSQHFVDTSRMKRFLTYVVEETLAGRAHLIKGYTLGVEVFDRPDNFDPQADTIVRVQAGQLRRRLDLFYSTTGQDDPVRIVIPKGAYVPKFEIREKPPLEDMTTSQRPARVLPIETQSRPGIAVLTFQNLSPDNKDSYFAEGLTIELVNALVQFRYLRIVARSASVYRGDLSTDLDHLSTNYGVQFALTGTVRRVKDLVRVSVDLISTETGDHIYNKIFDRKCTPDNLFEIQEEIASYLAANVGAPFGAVHRYNRRDNRGRRASMAGYDAILKYYEMNQVPTENKARDLLEDIIAVIKETPRFSSAWAIRALLEIYMVTQSVSDSKSDKRLDEALKYANRATTIDPENGLAFMALFAAQFHKGQIEDYYRSATRSLALNPFDYITLAYYSVTAAHIGQWDEAFSAQKAALSLISKPPKWFYAADLFKAICDGEYAKALEYLKDMDMDTAPAWAILHSLACAGHLGQDDTAKQLLKEFENRDADFTKNVYKTFKRWNPSPQLETAVIDGLRKAGLEFG